MKSKTNVLERLQAYGRLALEGRGYFAGQLELTSSCYQSCQFCDSWREDENAKRQGNSLLKRRMPFEYVVDVFQQLGEMPHFRHLALTGGDPQAYSELEDVLRFHAEANFKFELQINTALARPWNPKEPELWREVVSDLRVSLDGATSATYCKIRGDQTTTPVAIMDRLETLKHPRYSVLMCVSSKNVFEMFDVYKLCLSLSPEARPRKIVYLPVIGPRGAREEFSAEYFRQADIIDAFTYNDCPIETSYSENAFKVREVLEVREDWKDLDQEIFSIPCYSGVRTFHIKSSGDVYPCCLVGGEALETREEFLLGNVKTEPLASIQKNTPLHLHYQGETCRSICQFKQFEFNRIVHETSKERPLAMP